MQVLTFFITHNHIAEAKSFLHNVIESVWLAWYTHNRLPDAGNRMQSVIQFAVLRTKSIYYEDSTSHLIGMLLECTAMLNMEK